MASTNYALAAGYRAFVEQISDELFTKIFLGFRSGMLVTHHEGVKGKKVWTEMQVKSLVRRYNSAFAATNNIDLKPEVLEVFPCKVEHKEVPQDMESTYLGFLRRNGFNHQEWPLEAYTVMKLVEKIQAEFEVAIWQGDAADVPANTDLMVAVFDGFLKKIADAITATDLTPVVTGAITQANILDNLRAMYATLSSELKAAGVDIFMSYTNYDNYIKAYKAAYAGSDVAYVAVNGADYNGIRYELGGGNTTIVPVAGMRDSDRILMHRREHLHFGYDSMADWQNFRFQEHFRELFYWLDFKVGTHITLLRDGIAVVNDQA